MLIRDLEQQTGLDRATIRYYEKEGLIVPERKENSYREYTQENCEYLLKVKLLRQLEMPLQKIKELQEGRGDFAEAMEAQLAFLEEKQQRTNLTKQVCNQIRSAKENYKTLDASYYLAMLDGSQQEKDISSDFKENVPRDRNPWLRFTARMIDLFLVAAIMLFVCIVLLRIRPIRYVHVLIVCYVSTLLYIPWGAFCLHKWGTTPGKFVFGIHIESTNGGKLSYKDALWREINVLRFGMGFNVPLYGLWCNYKCYQHYITEDKLDYDEDCELFCDNLGTKKKIQLAALLTVCVLLMHIVIFDAAKPTFQGRLTVSEFSENYNDYVQIFENNNLENIRKMDIDGEWLALENDPGPPNRPVDEECSFQFVLEEGRIRTISYQNRWEKPFGFTPLDNERFLVAYTLAAAQENISYFNLNGFEKILRQKMYEENLEGSFTYENIKVSWKIDEEYTAFHAGTYFSRSNENVSGKTSYVDLQFEVTILDN